jgi:serine/threonine protein kinase
MTTILSTGLKFLGSAAYMFNNVHYSRDLKPENILLDMGGHVKLCDFGFAAKMAQSGITLGMGTSTNSESTLMDGCGTAMYVAPEIAEGFMKRAHGFPVDWWSLGCVLFEMLTGTAPFGDTEKMSKFEVFNNIAHRDVSCPLLWSKQLKDIVRGLLRKDPSTRFSWVNIELSEWLGMVNTPWFFCLHRILFLLFGMQIKWEKVQTKSLLPPWLPPIPSSPSTS